MPGQKEGFVRAEPVLLTAEAAPIAPTIALATTSLENSPTYVRAYVMSRAKEAGVNPTKVDWIVGHESQYGQHLVGPEPNHTTSYGYWQFNDANADFDYACAMNLVCSTNLALEWIKAGKIDRWSTYRLCGELFPNCPF